VSSWQFKKGNNQRGVLRLNEGGDIVTRRNERQETNVQYHFFDEDKELFNSAQGSLPAAR
jgi:hypothetical protein